MNISNHTLTTFCNVRVAGFEKILDVCDYVPIICQLSGKVRILLGALEIIVGLGWILKDFAAEPGARPVENDKQVGSRLVAHGLINVVRGSFVLSSYKFIKNIVCLVHDLCIFKIARYSLDQNQARFVEHLGFYTAIQGYIYRFCNEFKKDLDVWAIAEKLRELIVFPPLPGARVATQAQALLDRVAKATGSPGVAESVSGVGPRLEQAAGSARGNVGATWQALRSSGSWSSTWPGASGAIDFSTEPR